MLGIGHEERQDRRRDAVMSPCDHLAVLVEPRFQALDRHRMVEAVVDVVLASPHDFHRRAADRLLSTSAASTAKSGFDLRPKPPPKSVTLTVTFSGGRPSIWRPDHARPAGFARSSRLQPCRRRCGRSPKAAPSSHARGGGCNIRPRLSCLRSQMRRRSRLHCAGPCRAGARWPRVPRGRPANRRSRAARRPNDLQRLAALNRGPGIVGDDRDSADGWKHRIGGAGISTIWTKPGTFIASVASKETTLPPMTGGRATTAYFMPGRRMSWPYLARPGRDVEAVDDIGPFLADIAELRGILERQADRRRSPFSPGDLRRHMHLLASAASSP